MLYELTGLKNTVDACSKQIFCHSKYIVSFTCVTYLEMDSVSGPDGRHGDGPGRAGSDSGAAADWRSSAG